MANNKGTTGRGKKNSNVKKTLKEPIPINSGTSSLASPMSISAENTPLTREQPRIEDEIRRRAYELYEERGRQDGLHDEDWARAETEVLGKYGKKQEKSA